jgi:hypothetical protein
MIPRIAKLDKEFNEAVRAHIQARSRRRGILNQIASHVIHEGTSNSISRGPSENEPTKMFEAGAETKIGFDEIQSVDLTYILNKANEIADQFERHFSTHLFETMDDVTKKTGLRYDGGGKPLTNDALIEALSGMHMDFDKSGNANISIVAPPAMAATFQKLEAEMNEDPALRKRWDDMMEKKRDEFRTREINRNLAG